MAIKVEKIEGGIPHNTIMVAGLIATVICVYLTYANVLTGTQYFAFFGGLATVAALVWGSHTIKHLCSYGIGTGVPSAGMMAFGSGVIAMLFATKYGIVAPIIAIVLAAVIGAILGYLSNNVLNMRIPVMIQSLVEMAIIGALVLMGYAAMMSGSFELSGLTTGSVSILGLSLPSYEASFVGGALIATAFMLGGIAIQHPFNACLGPSWTQDRMLYLAAECGFLSMIAAAVMSMPLVGMSAALVSLFVAVVGWYYTYIKYIELSKRDAASWLDAKPIPEVEGL
ncbi:MAG TPA: tetrahydromethanopterin S-methyltransferase subunit C [Methanoregulaceae archaeon]|nr:MAG: tetrahydromethanopterin S-methyltransferase subunit C [Methanolinea sp.]HON81643.1 tetrahydromethanopterin S-methyltransferase subunit C [Methanoregulaceae archaeon]HPD10450.1 tetrahydromethanopterin S-methyltransferase subunit C [Methanoregulaceae archaeon]HRT15392.1 tetrahydromethanopterin S-methyltransferase subunit C [Methanoregulaceae archaeon]HRU31042.1 tetrahydromethanopterin S-methyltransferase subunit C [Methanoregulaceae archaeon]